MVPEKYEKTASDLMNTNFHTLQQHSTCFDVLRNFQEMGEFNKALITPIITPEGHLFGSVQNENLLEYLELFHTKHGLKNRQNKRKSTYSKRSSDADNFFRKTKSIYEKEVNPMGDSRVVDFIQLKTFNTNTPQEINPQWETKIEWDEEILNFDPSPLTVNSRCYSSKIQFLFQVTKVAILFVVEDSKLVGVITSSDFFKLKNS